MRRTRAARGRRGGFTIVEILVVVIIIAVLATLIVPAYFGRVGSAKRSVAKRNLAVIESAIEMFSSDYGRLPEGLDELVERPADVAEMDWNPPALKPKNLKDPWSRAYLYQAPGEHGAYDLYTLGRDGQEAGEKEDADVVN
ncbi:hypothetical protein LCGC14_2583360 [marine sediment metagenome]|uniref:Type II secretion system core protein G n=1 Tax=marine sediment metagenome TaxID=412755 RepID=A0A0F9D6L3_9ZZZZ